MTSPVLEGTWGAISGTGQTSYTSTLGVSVSGNYFHVLAITYEMADGTPNTIASVVAAGTSALTWTRKHRETFVGSQPAFTATEIWEASGTIHTGTADEVTITFSAAVDHAAAVGASFSLVNAINAFDPNSSLFVPSTITSPGGTPSLVASTTNPDDYLLAVGSTSDNTTIGSISFGGVSNDFNVVDDNSGGGTNFCRVGLGGLQVSAVQSGITVTTNSSGTNYQLIAFALTNDAPPANPPTSFGTVIF